MKKINPTKFLALAFLVMALAIGTITSCKKSTDEVTPTPTPTPKPDMPTNIFQSSFHKMITDDEISKNKTFHGSFLYAVGAGMGEDDPELPFGEIAKSLWEIHDYVHTEAEFKKIDTELDSIQSQIAELQNEIEELSQQLNLSTSTILNQLNTLLTNGYVTKINEAFDSTMSSGLLYYSSAAARIQSGQLPITMEQLDSIAMKDFVPKYGPAAPFDEITDAITQIQTLMLGSTAGPIFASSSLKQFADVLLQSQSSPTATQEYATNCYRVLENFFMVALNSQFRGFTIHVNALWRAEGADSVEAQNDYNLYLKQFAAIVQSELNMFLTVTDYLAVNMVDYRNSTSFFADAQVFFNYGIRPDAVCGAFIARANMINQLMNYALGEPTKDFYLTLALPKNYCGGGAMTWTAQQTYNFEIDLGTSYMQSRYPYTGWTYQSMASNSSSPDNTMVFYRDNDGTGGTGGVTMSTVNITLNNATWRHIKALTGSAAIGYYNPRDITAPPQSTKSATFSLCFGSASSCWYWGYLYLNDNTNNNMFEAGSWLFDNDEYWSYPSPWMANVTAGVQHTSSFAGSFNHGDNYLGYAGTFPSTPHGQQLSVGQTRTAVLNIGAANTTYSPSISVYFGVSTEVFGWEQSEERYFAGTDVSDNYSNLNLYNYYTSSSSKYDESVSSSAITSSGDHTFNVGFFALNPSETGNYNSCQMSWYAQVIYGGTYDIFP
jgi:DNA-binding Lrp family transcriptional regulator